MLKIGGELFWGLDALPMARAYLEKPDLFESEERRRLSTINASSVRAQA